MKINENNQYHLITPTSMGIRLTPENQQPFYCSDRFLMQATSAESNALSVAAFLGLKTKVLTAFVKNSVTSQFIKNNLKSRGMEFEGPELEQENPWGVRHQINMADSGFATRGPVVQNDRAGEVGRLLDIKHFDLKKILQDEGAQILHISGLIASLSPQSSKFCLELAKEAKKNGTLISFDLNHRESFWRNREDELHDIFTQIAKLSDILIGNEEDFQLCLRIDGPKAGGKDITKKINSFKEMIEILKKEFPQAKVFATTLREVESSNKHYWGAIVHDLKNWHIIEPQEIGIYDRIGGGDGFVGGLLYGILQQWDLEKATQFAWASGAFTATLLTDYAQVYNENQIWNVWNRNARVQR